MAFERSFDDGPDGLVSLMSGHDTLNGWDVLMSYSGVQLNALLAERAAFLKLDTPISWEAVSTDPLGLVEDHTLVFNVQLLQPTLKFVDTSNAVKLTFGLAGSFYAKDRPDVKAQQLPSGLTCELATSLVNVAGQWLDKGWQPATSTTDGAVGSNHITILEPGASVTRGICVDLTNCRVTLSQVPGTNIQTKTLVSLKPLIASFIEQHFSSHGLHLCLAAVANSYNVNDKTSEVLQPTQFCFTVAGGVLMIWIGLKGGPNTATRPSGQTALVFAPNSQAVSPIPVGRTASIIFSHDTMVNMFLKPALAASPSIDSGKEIVATTVKTNVGLKFNFTLQSNAIVIDEEKGSVSSTFGGEASYHVDGCTVNMNEKQVTLNVHCTDDAEKEPLTWPLALKWSTDSKRITSGSSYTSPEGDTSGEYAVAHITFNYGGHGTWSSSSDPIHHPNQLGVTWSLDSQLSLSIKPEEPTLWQSIACHKTSEIPSKYVGLRPTVPALDLTLKPLDYFLTTNLLLPGQHVFHADAPTFQSKTSGLAIPRDVILTGSVAPNSKSANVAHLAVQDYHLSVANTSEEAVFSHIKASQTANALTLVDFKNALLGFPANNLMGDFVQLIDKVDPAADEPFLPMAGLLEKYGFGHLAETNLMALWGTSLDELYGDGKAAIDAETPTDEVSTLDLCLYAGYYIVNQPADDQGEQFHVHPHTGAIRMRGKDIVPQQSYDAEHKCVVVTWQLVMGRVTSTYSASLSAVANKQTYSLGLKCVGTVSQGDDPAQPFEAYSKGFKTGDEVEAEAEAETNVAHISYLGVTDFGNSTMPDASANNQTASDASSISTTIYNIVQIASVSVALIYHFWKVTDYKKKNKAQTHVISQLQFERDGLHEFTLGTLEPLARTEYAKHGGIVDDALIRLEDRVNEVAREYLESKVRDDPHLIEDMARDEAKEREVRNYIADSVHQTLKEEAPKELNSVIKTVFEAVVAKNASRNTLNSERYNALLKSFQEADCARTIERLQSQPTPNSFRFTELAGQKSIDAALADLARITHEAKQKEYKEAMDTFKETEIERKNADSAKKKAAEAAKTLGSKTNIDALAKADAALKEAEKKSKTEKIHQEKARVEEKKTGDHHKAREVEKHHTAERMREKRRHVMGR